MNSTGIVPFEALSTVSIIYLRSFTYSASQTSAMESRVKLPPSKRLINFSIAFLSNSLSSSSVIRKQLLEKGIHINYENLMPVSAEQTSNEHIVRQKNIRKSTKRFSFRHVQLVSESQLERQFDDANVQRLQYVDKEE